MFELRKWKWDVCGKRNRVVARGKCYGNPCFPEGHYIRTSAIAKAELSRDSDRVILTTHSGNCYGLDFGEIDEEVYESTREKAKILGIDLDVERCLELLHQAQQRTIERLEGILEPCELYVKINECLMTEEAYCRTEQGEIVSVPVDFHVGMFTDSVIVGDYGWRSEKYPFEWRYMIDGSRISCYFWDEWLEAVKIFCEGDGVTVENFGRESFCKGHEITVIKRRESV